MHQRTGDSHGCVSYVSIQYRRKHILGVLGYVSWIGKVAERDASLTEILIECGAVLYVRTNVPQTLMVRFTSACMTRPW
jgi:amidase